MLLPCGSPRPRSSVSLGPRAEAADFAPAKSEKLYEVTINEHILVGGFNHVEKY